MSTIYTYHQECEALTAGDLAPDDVILVYDTSTGKTRRAVVSDLFAQAVVATTATSLTVTKAEHAGKTVLVNSTSPITITLPAATGSGAKYKFVMGVDATGTASKIRVANAVDVMMGYAFAVTTSSDNAEAFKTSATSDTISMNGTTQGGVAGDIYLIEDVAAGKFSVLCFTAPTGTEATPFSAAVS